MPNTSSKYPNGTAARILEVAFEEIGTVETGVNLTKYGKFTKADGLPWCGSFVNWCANEAGVKIPSMVSTALGAQKMTDLGRWKELPKLGDLCFMDFPHDGVDRISHIGIVAKLGLKSVLCIEGNTGDKDQRNGGMVMLKQRFIGKEIVGFARPRFVEYAGDFPIVELPKAATKEKRK